MLIHQNKWKNYHSFQDHFWTRSKKHNFLSFKEWLFMQQPVPELQWKLWMSKMLPYIYIAESWSICCLPALPSLDFVYLTIFQITIILCCIFAGTDFFRKFLSELNIWKIPNFNFRWKWINYSKGQMSSLSGCEQFQCRKAHEFHIFEWVMVSPGV